MSPGRRRIQTRTTWAVVVAWLAVYAVGLATADSLPAPEAAVVQLVVPALLLVLVSRLLLGWWWSLTDSRTSEADSPEVLLTAAVATLPEHRREWGRAMIGELAEVRGRSARWRFALSTARAALWTPPARGWPVIGPVAVVVAASVAVAGPAVGAAVPGLTVFAVAFTATVGAMVLLAVARARRLRLPAPGATILAMSGVAASIAVTVVLLRREPDAAEYFPPAAAVCFAIVLAGCLWVAVGSPRSLGTGTLAPHLGAVAGVAFAAWFLLVNRMGNVEPPVVLVLLIGITLAATPGAAFFVPAFVAGRVGRSLRSGVQAVVWTLVVGMPFTYAVWLPEGMRRHAIDGRSLDGEVIAPVGSNLSAALIFCLVIFPVIGLTLGLVGAVLGARNRAAPADDARAGQPAAGPA
jgi:hypothetical protein